MRLPGREPGGAGAPRLRRDDPEVGSARSTAAGSRTASPTPEHRRPPRQRSRTSSACRSTPTTSCSRAARTGRSRWRSRWSLEPGGDEVVFVSPPWFFYEPMILGAGATPIRVRTDPATFDLDVDAIEAALTPAHARRAHEHAEQPDRADLPRPDARAARRRSSPRRSDRRPARLRALGRVVQQGAVRRARDGDAGVALRGDVPGPHVQQEHARAGAAARLPGAAAGDARPRAAPADARWSWRSPGQRAAGRGHAVRAADIEHIAVDMDRLQRRRDRSCSALRATGYEVAYTGGDLLPHAPPPDGRRLGVRAAAGCREGARAARRGRARCPAGSGCRSPRTTTWSSVRCRCSSARSRGSSTRSA